MDAMFQGMMLDLLRYRKGFADAMKEDTAAQTRETEKRLEVLKEACEGNSSLLSEVEKLKSVALCGRR